MEWLGKGLVEVGNECGQLFTQVLLTGEAAVTHHATSDDSEYHFDLIQPGTVLGGEHETNPVTWIGDKITT